MSNHKHTDVSADNVNPGNDNEAVGQRKKNPNPDAFPQTPATPRTNEPNHPYRKRGNPFGDKVVVNDNDADDSGNDTDADVDSDSDNDSDNDTNN